MKGKLVWLKSYKFMISSMIDFYKRPTVQTCNMNS